MNELTQNLVKDYKPILAIVVYATGDQHGTHYLESHLIDNKGAVLAGKPLKQETIESIVDVFFDEQQNRSKIEGYIPESLLQFATLPGGHYRMVWYTPAQKRFLHFTEDLKIPSGEAWVPPLVWVADRGSLDLFATNTNVRPTPDTLLFSAPFHNTRNTGGVCLGNARIKKPTEKTYSAIMQYWHDMYWKSEFSHLTGTCPTKNNINMLWKRLVEDNSITWDQLDELLPVRKDFKLKNLLK